MTTINIRSVPEATKARLDFFSKRRGIHYAVYIDHVTRLHAQLERAARQRGGGLALAFLTKAGIALGTLEPPP
jgi:hypothetical protein